MSTRYVLPCPCGAGIPVETTQAGQMIRCACGRELEVPTLLALRSLEIVEEEERLSVAPSSWGVPQAICIVSVVIMLGAVGGLVFFYVHRPVPPEDVFTERIVSRDVATLTLVQSDGLWNQLRLGLSGYQPAGLAYRHALRTYQLPRYATMSEAYHAARQQYRIRIGVTLVILGLAAGTTAMGLVMARGRARSAARSEPAASSA